jgi:hypothetical protein
MNPASIVSSLVRRRSKAPAAKALDYFAAGKFANEEELANGADELLFRLAYEDENFETLVDIPYALKQLKDLHALMRQAVADVGERDEALTQHALFHPAFAAFVLGFSLGLVRSHRAKDAAATAQTGLSAQQCEQCEQWGVEIATYYLAAVDAYGIFGKASDVDLYGISDRWWLLADQERFESLDAVHDCVTAGRESAAQWTDPQARSENSISSRFREALQNFVALYPDKDFESSLG